MWEHRLYPAIRYTDSPVQIKTLDKRLAKASLFGPGYWYWLANLQKIWYFFSQVALHTCACEARKMSAKYREEKRVFKRPVRTSRSYSTGLNHLWQRLFVNRCESLLFYLFIFFVLRFFFFFLWSLHFPDPCLFKHTIVALTQNVSEKWTFLNSLVGCERKKVVLIYANVFIPGFWKPG